MRWARCSCPRTPSCTTRPRRSSTRCALGGPAAAHSALPAAHSVQAGRVTSCLGCAVLHILRRRAFSRAAVGVPCRTLAPKLKVPFIAAPTPRAGGSQPGPRPAGLAPRAHRQLVAGPLRGGWQGGGRVCLILACPSCGWESAITALDGASHPLWPASDGRLCCARCLLPRRIKLSCPLPAVARHPQVATEPRVEQFFVVRSKLEECATLPLERQVCGLLWLRSPEAGRAGGCGCCCAAGADCCMGSGPWCKMACRARHQAREASRHRPEQLPATCVCTTTPARRHTCCAS